MVNLVIDIGNTHAKVAVFDHRKMIRLDFFDSLTPERLDAYFEPGSLISHSILSSVSGISVSKLEEILHQRTDYVRFSVDLSTVIRNAYKSPHTLGLDRLAGAIGAHVIYPTNNCLIIDAGSCITYDLISSIGVYHGGSISPGLHMRLKALHTFTGKLPLIEMEDTFSLQQGVDTRTSILSGVVQGTVFEILGFITYYMSQYEQLQVILCGGDASFFDTRLKNAIFTDILTLEPNLVLIGLNDIIHQRND